MTLSQMEGWLLVRGWIWAKDPYYGESWQKGSHVAATAGAAHQYELEVLQAMPRHPTDRGLMAMPVR